MKKDRRYRLAFSFEEAYEKNIITISSGEKSLITKYIYPEKSVKKWLNENIEQWAFGNNVTEHPNHQVFFYFTMEEEMFRFKITWG